MLYILFLSLHVCTVHILFLNTAFPSGGQPNGFSPAILMGMYDIKKSFMWCDVYNLIRYIYCCSNLRSLASHIA